MITWWWTDTVETCGNTSTEKTNANTVVLIYYRTVALTDTLRIPHTITHNRMHTIKIHEMLFVSQRVQSQNGAKF
jgi:hypothetical protein